MPEVRGHKVAGEKAWVPGVSGIIVSMVGALRWKIVARTFSCAMTLQNVLIQLRWLQS